MAAGLPELSDWGREHPEALRVSAGTVNKQLGAVQAIAKWGYQNGSLCPMKLRGQTRSRK